MDHITTFLVSLIIIYFVFEMFFVKIMLESTSMQDYYKRFKRVKIERMVILAADLVLYACCLVFYIRQVKKGDDKLDINHPGRLAFFTIVRVLRILVDVYIGIQLVMFIIFFIRSQKRYLKT